ncbi:rod shape-determining protein MreB [Treponema sp. R6D11]
MPQDVGIDLGTASVLVYVKGKGIVLNEPSVVAVDTITGAVIAVGNEAQRMLGRTPGNIVAVRPLRDGVISDFQVTEQMLRHFLNKACKRQLFKPRVIICIPSGVTEVEERAVLDAAKSAGASGVHLIEEPLAAAIGANVDISKPYGNMVVDIGGGTTDVAVISLGGIVESKSIKIAGDKFDDAIIKFIRQKHHVLIGERTAEKLKKEIGCVVSFEDENGKKEVKELEVRGRCLLKGLPKSLVITSEEIKEALSDCADKIVEAVKMLLEITPPELIGDIATNGIVLTGGGALIHGLNKLIQEECDIECYLAENPVSCVAIGTGKALDSIEMLKETSYDRRKRRRA